MPRGSRGRGRGGAAGGDRGDSASSGDEGNPSSFVDAHGRGGGRERGRPRGSLSRQSSAQAVNSTDASNEDRGTGRGSGRGRGRVPSGSSMDQSESEGYTARGRGRPRSSSLQTLPDSEGGRKRGVCHSRSRTSGQESEESANRGRGRPRGSSSRRGSVQADGAPCVLREDHLARAADCERAEIQRSEDAACRPPRPPSIRHHGSVSSQGSQSIPSGDTDKAREIDRMLKKRLEELRLRQSEVGMQAEKMKKFFEGVEGGLNEKDRYPSNFNWTLCPSGSYYEKTKIDKPNEYDCMFVCDIRAKLVYESSPDQCYCKLELPTRGTDSQTQWEPKEVLCAERGSKTFICPRAFKEYFRKQVKVILKERKFEKYSCTVKQDKTGTCPAVTLDVKIPKVDVVISVDLVPAVRLMEWPSVARRWNSKWLPKELVEDIKNPATSQGLQPFIVPKVHISEIDKGARECHFWRLSFSAIEKEIMLRADGKHSGSSERTCRKKVLRLLKRDLMDTHATSKAICSYDIKNIFFNLLERLPHPSDWTEEKLRLRYVDALEEVENCLKKERIEHYFISSQNLFRLKNISRPELEKEYINQFACRRQSCQC